MTMGTAQLVLVYAAGIFGVFDMLLALLSALQQDRELSIEREKAAVLWFILMVLVMRVPP